MLRLFKDGNIGFLVRYLYRTQAAGEALTASASETAIGDSVRQLVLVHEKATSIYLRWVNYDGYLDQADGGQIMETASFVNGSVVQLTC